MRLDAVKFGLAVAIVAAIVTVIALPFAVGRPFGMMSGGYGWMHGGQMMRGGYGPGSYGHMAGFGWGLFAVGLVVRPVVAGVIAWATAAIYNRLLGKPADELSGPTSE